MIPVEYCASETVRQSGDHAEAIQMYIVWNNWVTRLVPHSWRLVEDDLKRAQSIIKNDSGHYRDVEVTFKQVTYPPMPAKSVPVAMKRLGEALNSKPFIDDKREFADYMAREFLIIHPFTDGNGRVASLMWNYLNGTILKPEPMPYFFGEG